MTELATAISELSGRLGPPTGEPVALDGGITNRNYRVTFGEQDVVVRLCGKRTEALGIDRDTECLAAERASGQGIAPAVVARVPGVLVTRFVEGRPLTPEELRAPEALAEVGAALRAFHAGPPLPTAFAVYDLAAEQAALVDRPPPDHSALVALGRRIEQVRAGVAAVPCHNDLLIANLLRTPDGLRIVDWEYAGMNDPYFDLGNLAANNDLETDAVLTAYHRRGPGDGERAALELLRYVSDLREAMWGVAQTALSDLDDVDFAAYAEEHLTRCRARAADPRMEDWLSHAATA